MEGKDKFEKLIISYLLGELNEQDETSVLERINSDKQSRQLFEELRKTVALVGLKNTSDKVDIDKEWSSFEEARLRKEHPAIFMNEAERFGNEVIREVNLKRKNRIFRTIAFTAVAASVILAIGWGWSLLHQQAKLQPGLATTSSTPEEKKPVVKRITRHLKNNSATAKQFFLQDGSEVMLAANSELILHEPFDSDRRDIRLKGSAYFKVAKDKSKPFTVFSEGISTTALGTRFTVTAFENSNRIRVTLHEGKVVVKGVEQLQGKVKKDYYLAPGQEFVFDKKKPATLAARVINAASLPERERNTIQGYDRNDLAKDHPSIPRFGKGSWYMFNNQSLGHVFEQLQNMYKTEIVYNKEEIAKIYFIGTFSKTDSLEGVLRQIVLVNSLKLTKENNRFIITK